MLRIILLSVTLSYVFMTNQTGIGKLLIDFSGSNSSHSGTVSKAHSM